MDKIFTQPGQTHSVFKGINHKTQTLTISWAEDESSTLQK